MAEVRITYWRDIPVLVTAREGADEVTVPLNPGFQDLVDWVAVREGLSESEAYLAQWQVGPEETRPGSPPAAAQAVAADLEVRLETLRARYLLSNDRLDRA
jgi:hypothetical protein